MATLHQPVMASEVLHYLAPRPDGLYVDATAGGGGHSLALLQAMQATGPISGGLLSLDADPAAVARASERISPYAHCAVVVQANFRTLATVAPQHGFAAVDGILLDLGLSSDQLEDVSRGLSLMADGPLDMRLDPGLAQTAADLVNELAERDLADLIYRYGEDRQSRRIARAIVLARPVYTTARLAEVIARAVGRRSRIHPATRSFQALRIAVNEELDALEEVLPQAVDLLRPCGRLVVISFHSLEDRIVKQFMQHEARDCVCPPSMPACQCGHKATLRVVTRKPVEPSPEEVALNPRSRSAKLRVAERLCP